MLSEQSSDYSVNVYIPDTAVSTQIPRSGQDVMCYTLDEYHIEILCIKIIWFIFVIAEITMRKTLKIWKLIFKVAGRSKARELHLVDATFPFHLNIMALKSYHWDNLESFTSSKSQRKVCSQAMIHTQQSIPNKQNWVEWKVHTILLILFLQVGKRL